MKKLILAVTVLTMAAAGVQSAKAGGIHFGFSASLPLPPLPLPVLVTPPAPVVAYPAPAYCPPPAPVVVYSAPAYCPPPVRYAHAPVIGFRYEHGRHYRYDHHDHRGRW